MSTNTASTFYSMSTSSDYMLFKKRPKSSTTKVKSYMCTYLPYVFSLLFFLLFLSKHIQYNSIEHKYIELNQKVLAQIFAPYHSDIITSLGQLGLLKRMIRQSIGIDKSVSLRLIYKASLHGGTAKDFHNIVTRRNSYIVLIKDDKDILFEGFTTKNFDSLYLMDVTLSYEIEDKEAFLFSLTNEEMYPVIKGKEKCSIQGDEEFGPIFGKEGDLWVVDDFLNKESHSAFPSSFNNEDNIELLNRLTQGRQIFLLKKWKFMKSIGNYYNFGC